MPHHLFRHVHDRADLRLSASRLPAADAVPMHLGSMGRAYTPDGFRTEWRKLMQRVGPDGQKIFMRFREERVVFHGLRKNAVINLLEAGCTESQVCAIVTWRNRWCGIMPGTFGSGLSPQE